MQAIAYVLMYSVHTDVKADQKEIFIPQYISECSVRTTLNNLIMEVEAAIFLHCAEIKFYAKYFFNKKKQINK